MTDTAPPEQVLIEAADHAMELANTATSAAEGTYLAYLAGLIRGGITNLAIAYDRGWDEGYDAAPTPLAAPADMAAVWQGLNDEQRAVVCIVSPELAGMLDAAEDPAPVEVTLERAQQSAQDAQDALTRAREDTTRQIADMRLSLAGKSEMGPPPYYLARLRKAIGLESDLTFDEIVEQVEKLRDAYLDRAGVAERYYGALVEALELDAVASTRGDGELLDAAVGVITRARRAAEAWAGNGEPGTPATTLAALQDLARYLDERAA